MPIDETDLKIGRKGNNIEVENVYASKEVLRN